MEAGAGSAFPTRGCPLSRDGPPVGFALGAAIEPERIPPAARLGEQLGFSELWLAEDPFYTAGISSAAAALSATEQIPVGLGIVSAMVRHPALLAMECATLARMFPGRFRPGIGLGLPYFVKQMGLYPRSPLGAMRECLTGLRRLLDGEEVTERGECFSFDRVRLAYPLAGRLPLYAGVMGPKMLRLSGELADGTIASIFASAEWVRFARGEIAAGAAAAGRPGDPHRLVVFALFSCDADGQRARDSVRSIVAFYLAFMGRTGLSDAYGISDRLVELVAGGALERELPDRWLSDLCVVGDPDECAAQIRRLLDAGGDSVVLIPMPAERTEEQLRLAAAEVLPRLQA